MKNAAIKIEYKTQALKATQLRQTARKYRADSDKDGVTKEERKALRKEANRLLEEANDGRWERRQMHLAYCYLKGRTYHQCEAKCDPDNRPSIGAIASDVNTCLGRKGKTEREVTTGHIEFWIKTGDLTRRQIEATYHQKKAVENADKARQDAFNKVKRATDELDRYKRQKADYERRAKELDTHRIPAAQKNIDQAQELADEAQKTYRDLMATLRDAQREPEYPLGHPDSIRKEVAA